MLPDRGDEMLKSYRESVGRCGHLENEIQERRDMLESLRETVIEDSVLAAQPLSGMPRSGKVSDPTAQIGSAAADGWMTSEMKHISQEIRELERELRSQRIVVHFVTAWLNGLNEKERWIIEKQVIDGAYWREVIFGFKAKFGDEYSKDGLKRIKRSAMNKIYRIAS